MLLLLPLLLPRRCLVQVWTLWLARARINHGRDSAISPARAQRHPDLLLQHAVGRRELAVAAPRQPAASVHGAVAQPAVGDPLAHHVADKGNLAPKVVGGRDALQGRLNLGAAARGGRRRRLKVEERLERPRQGRALVKRRVAECARGGELLGRLFREVPKVAPVAGRVEGDLCVVGEVELWTDGAS